MQSGNSDERQCAIPHCAVLTTLSDAADSSPGGWDSGLKELTSPPYDIGSWSAGARPTATRASPRHSPDVQFSPYRHLSLRKPALAQSSNPPSAQPAKTYTSFDAADTAIPRALRGLPVLPTVVLLPDGSAGVLAGQQASQLPTEAFQQLQRGLAPARDAGYPYSTK